MIRAIAALSVLVGLLLFSHLEFWAGLLGLQLLAMGYYLVVVARTADPTTERLVLGLRLGWLAPASSLVSWFLALTEALFWLGRPVEATAPQPSRPTSRRADWHNGLLGLFPLFEGSLCLLAPEQAARWLFAAPPPAHPTLAFLFGAHSLHLGLFWFLMVSRQRWDVLRATAWGRFGVALAFVFMATAGLAPSPERMLGLAGLLCFSCVWTVWSLDLSPAPPFGPVRVG